MPSITSSNAVLMLSVDTIFPTPQQLQGFGADDIFDVPTIRSVEVVMGVDGVLSGGFTPVPIPQTITLQADSASNDFFETWWTQMQAAKDVYIASGLVMLRSIGAKYAMSGGLLTGYKPIAAARRKLDPRTFEITWASVFPQPA